MKANWFMAASAAILAMSAPLHAAIYVKIPDIKGESPRAKPGVEPDEIDVKMSEEEPQPKDSGEAHLDYLIITLSKASNAHEVAHVVQQAKSPTSSEHLGEDVGIRWGETVAPEARRAPERLRHRDRATNADAPRGEATAMATGKRQHRPFRAIKPIDKASPLMLPESSGPGSVTIASEFEGCSVGRTYPHVLLGDDEAGREATLLGVTVASCASEEFTLNYEKIKS